ncbi:MAG TPA: ISKra4 family transposase, partial [Kineosporiaceae bacterium]
QRKSALEAATYLTNKAPYLDYPTALAKGWPIATGVIEGACRHLVKDRLEITGARWGLATAEAVLALRAITTNGDFHDYWHHHQQQEHHRTYPTRTARTSLTLAA